MLNGDVAARAHQALVQAFGSDGARRFIRERLKSPYRFLLESAALDYPAASFSEARLAPWGALQSERVVTAPPVLNISPTEKALRMPTTGRRNRWLRSGLELVVHPPGQAPWDIPLNFSEITLGSSGPRRNDVELNYPGMANRQLVMRYEDGAFRLTNENPQLEITVNGEPVIEAVVADDALIVVGPVWMQIFKVLDIAAELQVISGPDAGRRFKLQRSTLYIGRRGMRYNDIELVDPSISRTHARLEFTNGGYVIQTETANSITAINGEIVRESASLKDGDQLTLGHTFLAYRMLEPGRTRRELLPAQVTILFSDLRGYSTIAERQPLKPLIDQLNEYLQAMGKVIHVHGGTLLSYQGDAIMAVFGAPTRHPDDPHRAVFAGLSMLRTLATLNSTWKSLGRPEFRAGIGINTGTVMVGDIGTDEHLEYAAVGDDTNIAARLEEMTRHYDADMIISDRTREQIDGAFIVECLGQLTVKGRDQGVTCYKVIGPAR